MICSPKACSEAMGDTLAGKTKTVTSSDGSTLYGVYGLTLASDFRFASRLMSSSGSPDLSFHVAKTPLAVDWNQHEPAYASSSLLTTGESLLYVYRQEGYDVLRFTEVADYYLWPESIVCHLLDPAHDYVVEIYLLGLGFSLWLELQGIPALHASAVVVEDRAAAFLATNSGGKSSLAATLMQAGYPLLTDDVLPIERSGETFKGRPGYPQMRMWPEQAQLFLGHYEDLDIVHPAYSKRRVPVGKGGLGTFCGTSQSLACLYIPERRDPVDWGTGVEISPLSRQEALMSLVGQSFAAHIVDGLGLQRHRLNVLASLVSRVPIRRIAYPDGFEYLPSVRSAILEDLAGL